MRTGRKCAATAGAQGPPLHCCSTPGSSMGLRVQALSLPLSFLSVLLSFLVPPSMTFSGFEHFWAPVPYPPFSFSLLPPYLFVTLLSITITQGGGIFYYLVSLINQVLCSLFFIFKVDECHTIFSY